MGTRVGIELTATRCSLVSLDCAEGEQGRILAFKTIEYSPGDAAGLTSELQQVAAEGTFPRRVNAVVWDARSVQQIIPVPARPRSKASADAITEAHRILPDFRLWADDAWVGCSRVEGSGSSGTAEVLFAAMSGADIRARLQPLVTAGFTIDEVATPALALTGIARWRRWDTPAVTAYLVMNRDGGSLLINEAGRVLLTRDLPWEYQHEHPSDHGRLLERYAFAGRIATQLQEAFAEVLRYGRVVSQVVTCGNMPGLRSMTMPLIAELDIEVETLDSMAGIDVAALPEPASQFGEQVASLRLAWAMAAWAPSVRLKPHVRPVPFAQRTARVAAAAVVAAGVVFGAMALPSWGEPGPVSVLAADVDLPPESRESRVRLEYSSDRQIAVLDDQILLVGDTIGSATVADITRDAVILRLASGKEKRLSIRSPLSGDGRR